MGFFTEQTSHGEEFVDFSTTDLSIIESSNPTIIESSPLTDTTGDNTVLYIIIGASVGGVIVLICISIGVIIYMNRKRHTFTADAGHQTVGSPVAPKYV